MYLPGTILKLREQRPPTVVAGPEVEIIDKNGKGTGKYKREEVEQPFPYNHVRVIGPSPLTYTHQRGAESPDRQPYDGADAQGVIIQPVSEFAMTLDEPYGKLRRLYEITELPEEEFTHPVVRVHRGPSAIAGPTPEEVFADKAPADTQPDVPRTAKRVGSPLEDPRPKTKPVSPLD